MSAIEEQTSPALPAVAAKDAASALGLTVEIASGSAWDAAVADFDEVCQEQLHAFSATRWPGTVQEPVLFRQGGELVGGALMMIQPLPLRLGAIAVSKWGPMLKDAGRADAEAIHAGMIELLIADYARARGMMLSVLPRAALEADNRRHRYLVERGFRRGSELLYPSRYIVNLRLDDAGLRKSFAQKWRYHLNKSEKEGLAFEHADVARMDEFHALYSAMTDRKQFSDHSAYDTVDTLMTMKPPNLRPELFFVRHESGIVAGAIIFTAGDRAVYLYGATSDRALPLRAGYFLHWHVIRWLRDNTRANWYDLGGTDGYQGLHQFKKGMVGEAGVIRPVPPVANYADNPMALLVGEGAFAARDAYHQVQRTIHAWRNPKARPDQPRSAENGEAR
ncbi:lipid II:glycine glycyltransferase FemX [Devosia nitrariae]|uniref:BioF2-like acetyltransferase domain-containing protein n=1 Tax=Devosia nitrariae TaxID=2071872 RepID=A0ABQ5W3G8_9HYPH|nr:GNAT family N-acetyltransferase [Devosia nitrariae]GLQ54617.1 hypothetical protein GCM10010862_18760 [Devosia nitrariae]